MPPVDAPQLLVGYASADDGAVYRLDGDTALVQTVDFFTPIVDDARVFGAISAANALSDIYAMGGRPITALSLVCFPDRDLPAELLADIAAGGAAKIAESGAVVAGGHSVSDPEIKFGYAVTGLVEPDRLWRNDTPQPGDALLLTKPLGTGLITTAVKQDKLAADSLAEPIREMTRLNRAARDLARDFDIHAATDVTGYGLMGHLFEMLRGRELGAQISAEALPLFDHVWTAITAGAITGAHRTNVEYVSAYRLTANAALEKFQHALYDPQTSGGLLLALPPDQAQDLLRALTEAGHRAAVIGGITAQAKIDVR